MSKDLMFKKYQKVNVEINSNEAKSAHSTKGKS